MASAGTVLVNAAGQPISKSGVPGTTIVKLITTTQAGGKPTTIISPSTQIGGTKVQPTILGISSITQQGKSIIKTIPIGNMQKVGVGSMAGKTPTIVTVTTKVLSSTSVTPTKYITTGGGKPKIMLTNQVGLCVGDCCHQLFCW